MTAKQPTAGSGHDDPLPRRRGGRRYTTAVGLAAASTVLLSACGTDYNPQGAGDLSPQLEQLPVDCSGKQDLSAEGSSAQKNAMDIFTAQYSAKCQGNRLAYTKSGSGKGVSQFSAGLVDFGGSDSALKEEKGEPQKAAQRCGGNPAWNLPMVFGPVAIAYNLPGVPNLNLTPEVTGKIFKGEIKTWNDPAIAQLNPGAPLPDTQIMPFYRSDESGTSDNFQKYLSTATNGQWQGEGKQFQAGSGVGQGREGSDGVANGVRSAPGGITYVEWSYAKNAGLGMANLDSGSGPVELNPQSVGKAIEEAKPKKPGHDMALDTKSIYGNSEPGVYPLVLTTYEIVCSRGYDPATSKSVKAFLNVAANADPKELEANGYVPLPDSFKRKLTDSINAIA